MSGTTRYREAGQYPGVPRMPATRHQRAGGWLQPRPAGGLLPSRLLGRVAFVVVLTLIAQFAGANPASAIVAEQGERPSPGQLTRVSWTARSFWSEVLAAGSALTAGEAAETSAAPNRLSSAALRQATATASAQWQAAGADTAGIKVAVGDLPGLQLAYTTGRSIVVTRTPRAGAGNG